MDKKKILKEHFRKDFGFENPTDEQIDSLSGTFYESGVIMTESVKELKKEAEMKKKNCPVCGGGNISLKKKTKTLTDSFGVKQEVEVNIYSCPDCGTEGDLFKENGAVIKKALRAAERQSAENIIKFLSEDGFKLSMIERVLGLSQRTLTKWKIGATQPSAPGVSLLKFIKVFPWLLDVADNNYDKDCADRILLEQLFCCTGRYNKVITASNDKGFVAV